MNWTGGGLSRSRHANSSISAKQKNHFAKVRARLQGAQSTPKNQSFDLGHWRPEYEIKHPSQSVRGRQPGHLQQQTILDDIKNVRPLVKKLENLHQPKMSSKRKRSPLAGHIHQPTRASMGKAMSPIIVSSRPSSMSSTQSSVTPIGQNANSPRSSGMANQSLTTIGAKRRRLLQMDDWVGVERRQSKPAHMKFTEAEDRDMIGKRRQMNKSHYKLPHSTSRSSERKAYLDETRVLVSPYQDFSVGQMSIKIGSTVGRSQASIRSEEMLFDSEVHESSKRPLLAAPIIQPGELASLPPSALSHREVRTPAAFMGDSSSAAPVIQDEYLESMLLPDHDQCGINIPSEFMNHSSSLVIPRQPSQRSSPKHQGLRLPVDDHPNTETIIDSEGPEQLLPQREPEPAHEQQSFRLVFENTPQPPSLDSTHINSPVHEFGAPTIGAPLATSEMPAPSRGPIVRTLGGDGVIDKPPSKSLARSPHPSGNAIIQPPSKYQGHASIRKLQLVNSSGRYGKDGLSYRDHSPELEKLQACREEHLHSVPRKNSYDKDATQSKREEESMWRSFTIMDEMEDTKSLKVRPTSNNTAEAPTTDANPNSSALPSTLGPSLPKPTEDEERIWRAFIFSDDDNNPNNEWTLESPAPPTQSSSLSNPTRTQPSTIAEAATSPIKQNPHLHEASPTISPTKTLHQFRPSLPPATINHHGSAFIHSLDLLAGVSPHKKDSLNLLADGTARSELLVTATDASLTAQQTKGITFTPWTLPSIPKTSGATQSQHFESSSLSAQVSTTSSSSPNPALPHPLPNPSSSLIAQAPSTAISSDELHGSQPCPIALKPRPKPKAIEPRIVFTPPERYVGSRAAEARKPVRLGRVLRKGKRLGTGTRAVARKGRGQGRGKEQEQEQSEEGGEVGEGGKGDDIVDD